MYSCRSGLLAAERVKRKIIPPYLGAPTGLSSHVYVVCTLGLAPVRYTCTAVYVR